MNPFSKLFKTLTVSALAVLAASSAQATNRGNNKAASTPVRSFANEFRSAALQVPLALIEKGYTNFGRLNLDRLVLQIRSSDAVIGDPAAIKAQNFGYRSTAHWTNTSNFRQISVAEKWWREYDGQQAVLALHEVLGEFGFADDMYWLSTSMWTLTLPEVQILTSTEVNVIVHWIGVNAGYDLAAGGTVIGVGGGGESTTLWWRMQIIKLEFRRLMKAQTPEEHTEKWEQLEDALASNVTSSTGGLMETMAAGKDAYRRHFGPAR